jgi:hypothetical protein
MRQPLREDVGGELADSELADLLPPLRQLVAQAPLVADADEPVALEAFHTHALAVVDDNDGCVLIVQAGGEDYLDTLRARVERVGNELFNGLVRASVEALRK